MWQADRGRRWGIRIDPFPGPWFSIGIHVDVLHPVVDLHLVWWLVSLGRIYHGGRWQWRA
jgi:hypothetical protein